jgi:putative ABC transport system ATP-binding protein
MTWRQPSPGSTSNGSPTGHAAPASPHVRAYASTAADPAVARCEAMGRTYGTGQRAVVAVYDATCVIGRGDRVAIMGPSGSGKSTLLHLLAGLETPSAGQISWPALHGHPREGAHRVGLVFQAPTLIPSMSVLENVELPMLLTDIGAGEARERARAALHLVGLDGLCADLPQELSGGQAQRVVIARVLAARPRLILADEPTSQLDRRSADHVTDVLIQVSEEIGAALVIATHDSAIGARMHTAWPMHDGRLRAATRQQFVAANTDRATVDTSRARQHGEGDQA